MPTLVIETAPWKNKLVDAGGFLTSPWARWISNALIPRTEQAAPTQTVIALTGQQASIGTTAIYPLASGTYRVNWSILVTQAAGTSSSIQLAISATDGGVSVTHSVAAYTGNSTTAPQSGVFIVKCDASTPLSYSTTYASSGSPVMQHRLDVIVEGLV